MTIAEFLAERLDEDEAWAVVRRCDCRGDQRQKVDCPIRVSDEVAAKRAIVADLSRYCFNVPSDQPPCGTCDRIGCRNLRELAEVYSDHADFNKTWRA